MDIHYFEKIDKEQEISNFEEDWKVFSFQNKAWVFFIIIMGVLSILHTYFVAIQDKNYWVGLISITIGGLLLYSNWRRKSLFRNGRLESLKSYTNQTKNIEVLITNEYVYYKDELKEVKLNWSLFRKFKLEGDNLYLFENTKINQLAYRFNLASLSEEELRQLRSFLNLHFDQSL